MKNYDILQKPYLLIEKITRIATHYTTTYKKSLSKIGILSFFGIYFMYYFDQHYTKIVR